MSENKLIQKPISVAKRELQEQIIQSINNSGLPLILSAYILEDVLKSVNNVLLQQEKQEQIEYEAQLENSAKEQSKKQPEE